MGRGKQIAHGTLEQIFRISAPRPHRGRNPEHFLDQQVVALRKGSRDLRSTHCCKMPADAVAHESLDLGGWYASDAAGFGLAILQKRMRHIVPVTHAAFVRMRWAHPVAAVVEEAAGERSGRAPEPELPGNDIGGAPGLHGFEQIAGEDRLMLAAMHLASIDDLADVEPVLEQMGKRSDAEADAAAPAAIAAAIDLGPVPCRSSAVSKAPREPSSR
jgi:hypothetical protein